MAKTLFRVVGIALTMLGAVTMLFIYTGTIAMHSGAGATEAMRLVVVDWITPTAIFTTGVLLFLFATPLAKLVALGGDAE
jgi:hypothetical protein